MKISGKGEINAVPPTWKYVAAICEELNKLHKKNDGFFTEIRWGFVQYPLVKLWKWCYHL